jgi:hypothetical protein
MRTEPCVADRREEAPRIAWILSDVMDFLARENGAFSAPLFPIPAGENEGTFASANPNLK